MRFKRAHPPRRNEAEAGVERGGDTARFDRIGLPALDRLLPSGPGLMETVGGGSLSSALECGALIISIDRSDDLRNLPP